MNNIDKKFRFREFQVYKDARSFNKEIKNFFKNKLPKEEKFILLSQLWRAADSIILNIAEGSDRGTDKDFALFLNRSHTSVCEVVACLDIAFDDKYISLINLTTHVAAAAGLSDQLTAFRRKLIKNPSK